VPFCDALPMWRFNFAGRGYARVACEVGQTQGTEFMWGRGTGFPAKPDIPPSELRQGFFMATRLEFFESVMGCGRKRRAVFWGAGLAWGNLGS
jgi:hypothetical protein